MVSANVVETFSNQMPNVQNVNKCKILVWWMDVDFLPSGNCEKIIILSKTWDKEIVFCLLCKIKNIAAMIIKL